MTRITSGDPVLDRVAALPTLSPDQQTRARVRARCHGILIARQERETHRPGIAGVLVDGALGFVSFLYLAGAMAQALRLIAAIR